jgi:hypothetical protein
VKRQWAVYYRTREYARVKGDPCLGYVWAASVGEALDVARAGGMGVPDAPWVVPVQEKERPENAFGGVSPVGALDSLRVKQERWSRESE